MRRNEFILSDLQPSLHNHVGAVDSYNDTFYGKRKKKTLSEELKEERIRLFGQSDRDIGELPKKQAQTAAERQRKYRERNRERTRSYVRDAKRKNPEQQREYKNRWQQNKRKQQREEELKQLRQQYEEQPCNAKNQTNQSEQISID